MTTFTDSLKTEERGWLVLKPWLEAWSSGAPLRKLEGAEEQKRGDFVVTTKTGVELSVDLKIVEQSYDRFFFETWSNKQVFTEGWLWTSQADRIVWLYLSSGDLFVLDLPALRLWAAGSIEAYDEVQQTKCEQLNDSWGRLVPRDIVRAEVGFVYENNVAQLAARRAALEEYQRLMHDHRCWCGELGTRSPDFGRTWFCWPHDIEREQLAHVEREQGCCLTSGFKQHGEEPAAEEQPAQGELL